MMKKIACLCLLCLLPLSVFATDFGVILDNTTSLLTVMNKLFFQKDKLTIWTLFDLTENIAFNIEGYYRFNIQDPYHAYSLDRLEFSADFPVPGDNPFLFGFALGRLRAADFTNYVVSHPVDGGRIVFRNSFLNAELCGGFTGLLFKGDSLLVMSQEDANYSPELMPLVPPRLVGVLNLDFPELLAPQTIDLTVAGQLDLHSETEVVQPGPAASPDIDNGGKIDSLYAGIGISGPLFPKFFWACFFYFEFGRTLSYDYVNALYQYTPIYAFFGGLKLDWYLVEAQKVKLSLDVLVSSGDPDYESYIDGNTDAYSMQFVPVTRPTIGIVFAQQLTNLIVGRLELSMRPFIGPAPAVWDNLQVAVAALTYFRSSRSFVSDSRGQNEGSPDYYLGSEADLVVSFKPISDLWLELALGLFLPNNYTADSAFAPDGRSVEFLARFQFTLDL